MMLTVKEAAKLLRVCAHTVYAKVRSGELKSLKVGRSIRLPLDQFRGAMETHQLTDAVDREAAALRERHAEAIKREALARGRKTHPALEDR